MHLQKIQLKCFKNFEQKSFDFSPKINAFVGNNGVGKTNLLDAVYYLSFFKSYFHSIDSQNVRFGEEHFYLNGDFFRNEKTEQVECGYQIGQKKKAKRNGKLYERLTKHIGQFPVVIISPYDRDLITEGSDIRRKFMDRIISQSDNEYLTDLVLYNKTLSQRNTLLKYFAANRTFDAVQLEIYDDKLLDLGKYIHQQRKKFITDFLPIFQKYYAMISGGKEEVFTQYRSHLEQNTNQYLTESLERDRLLQYTTKGVHKDDLELMINENPVKKFGSQGQQKSFLIALKLAQLELVKKQLGITPILLLDDVFDKLDESRVEQLINLVNEEHFGQIFLSDTHPDRTESIVKKINEEHKIFRL